MFIFEYFLHSKYLPKIPNLQTNVYNCISREQMFFCVTIFTLYILLIRQIFPISIWWLCIPHETPCKGLLVSLSLTYCDVKFCSDLKRSTSRSLSSVEGCYIECVLPRAVCNLTLHKVNAGQDSSFGCMINKQIMWMLIRS